MAITPHLYYQDVDRAMTFLAKAFEFRAFGAKMRGADGRTIDRHDHATAALTRELVMLTHVLRVSAAIPFIMLATPHWKYFWFD
jgi:hypothetical protein